MDWRYSGWASITFGAALVALFFTFRWANTTTAQTLNCAEHGPLVETFAVGTKWEMCWELRPNSGVVLTDIHYTTASGVRRKVLDSAAIAQLYATFDDGSAERHHVTDVGLGSSSIPLTSAECSQTLHQHNKVNVLCQQLLARGYLYKFHALQEQSAKLQLHSVSFIGEQSFIVQWSFFDDGTIEPAIGYSGQLERIGSDARYGWPLGPNDRIGIGKTTIVYWRLAFDLGGDGVNDIIEEIEAVPTNDRYRKEMHLTPLLTESGRSVDPELKRSWRVLDAAITNADGHAISYQLEPLQTSHQHAGGPSWAAHDIYFTNANACEQFASHNPTGGGCGATVTAFADGGPLTQPVLWYGVTYHHLARDEDELFRPIVWNSYQLLPRDWTADSEVAQ